MSEEKTTAGKVGMDAFDIVKKSNDGVKMPLLLPDGTETDEYLVIRGADSQEFRREQAKANRDLLELAKDKKSNPVVQDQKRRDIQRNLVASLVVGWSFEQSCQRAEILAFLVKAPQVQDGIDIFAGNRSNFFVKPSQD